MIAISSHKPFSDNPVYADNQERAGKTWRDKFQHIYYFGSYEKGLDGSNVRFARKDEDWPRLKQMAGFASQMDSEHVAIINADIVLTEEFHDVQDSIHALSLPASTSYRYEFNPVDYPNLDGAVRDKEDRGMDIFVATPAIWKMVAKDIPETLWFGHNCWDTWVCGYFCHHLGYGFRHFTEKRCVFHPKHEGRKQPNVDRIVKNDPYLTRAKRPSPL